MVTFKAKIRMDGNSHVVTIPSDYIKHGLLDKDIEYEIEIKEDDKDETNKGQDIPTFG